MSLITIPSFETDKTTLILVRPRDNVIRLMDGSKKHVSGNDAEWQLEFPVEPLSVSEARAWKAALVQLSRPSNTFEFGPPELSGPGTGYSGPDPLVNGAGQLGTSLVCDGVTANTAILSAGDHFEVNGEFKVAIAAASSDGSGNVTFNFEPALRASPSNNEAVEIQDPKLTLELDQAQVQWALRRPAIYGISLTAIESF